MLKRINQYYLIFGSILFLLFLPKVNEYYYSIYLANFISLLSFGFIIKYFNGKNEKYYNKTNLLITVFVYSIFFVGINKFLSYYYTGNFFVFNKGDSVAYHNEALRILSASSYTKGIESFLNYNSFDDLGATVMISLLYYIIESNLFVNLFYIITGCITALCIFRIGKNFINVKYAFLAALTYSISSYVIWFHSSGLKESFMIMLIILFFDQYYIFKKTKNIRNILFMFFVLTTLTFFRPILCFFELGSIGISQLFSRKLNLSNIFILLIVIISMITSFSLIEKNTVSYTKGGNIEQILERTEDAGISYGSSRFIIAVNAISSAFGPFPNLIPNNKPMLSFYASGLIFRVFISLLFWIGVYYVFKFKLIKIYPIIIFPIIEMFSLVFILDAIELRKSLIHFPMFYLITFWAIDLWNKNEIDIDYIRGAKNIAQRTIKNKKKLLFIFKVSIFIFFIMIILWNNRI